MDRLDAMGAFVATADLKGFAPAARRLNVSASAVTRMVAALEAKLGIRLLQRTTRRVTLTDAGARYLERARRILASVDEAESAAQAERIEPTGHLVISAPTMFGRINVAPVLNTYLSRFPAVSGELLLTDRRVNLIEEGVDLAVRIGVLSDSNLFARRVGQTRRVVVASPDYLARHGEPRDPGELGSHAVTQLTTIHPTAEWRFWRRNQEELYAFTPKFVTNSADAALGHALAGGGLVMTFSYQTVKAVRAKRLRVVLAKFEPPPLPIHLVHPSTRLLSAKVRAFTDLVIATRHWQFME